MVRLRWSTAVLPGKLVSELYRKEQNLSMLRLPSALFFMRVVFFILAGFCFQIKSKTILLTSVAKFFGVSITLKMNTSLERANVLTIFILPYMDRSLRNQTLNGHCYCHCFLPERIFTHFFSFVVFISFVWVAYPQ